MTSADDHLHMAEVVLRTLCERVLRDAHGADWESCLGVTDERMATWQERREVEGKARSGSVADHRLLSYANFTDLWTILRKNWDLFKPCFRDRKRLEVYLDRLGALRNPGAHSRQLLPFEAALVEGMTGEIRQQVTLFESKGGTGPEPEHFPRIEEVVDSFGNRSDGGAGVDPSAATKTGLTLRPGEAVDFTGRAWDPDGRPLSWRVRMSSREIFVGDGDAVAWRWTVEEQDISETALLFVELRSDRAYHRRGGVDDQSVFFYRILPPLN